MRNARATAVRQAWAAERKIVAAGGQGSRRWTAVERKTLIETGNVPGYDGHHINTVNGNSIEMARNPNNIQFLTKVEHSRLHSANGGTRTPITGRPMIVRGANGLGIITGITGILSGRIRTDTLDNMISDWIGMPSQQDIIDYNIQKCGTPQGCA